MEIFNFDAETIYNFSTICGLIVVSGCVVLFKRIAAKTTNTIDDRIAAKLEEYVNSAKNSVKTKKK